MMYRSGWGTQEGQEVTLALRPRRDAFDEILRLAVHSTFVPVVHGTHEAWQLAVAGSEVRFGPTEFADQAVRHGGGGRRPDRLRVQPAGLGHEWRCFADRWGRGPVDRLSEYGWQTINISAGEFTADKGKGLTVWAGANMMDLGSEVGPGEGPIFGESRRVRAA